MFLSSTFLSRLIVSDDAADNGARLPIRNLYTLALKTPGLYPLRNLYMDIVPIPIIPNNEIFS